MQNDYNLLYREDENEMLPTLKVRINRICNSSLDDFCQYFGVGSIPWTSLARGAMVMTLDQQFALPYDGRYVSSPLLSVPAHLSAQNPRRTQGLAQYDHYQVAQ